MNLFASGYVLPGNIYKSIWSLKEKLFELSNDPAWIFFPPVIVLQIGQSPPEGIVSEYFLSGPLAFGETVCNRYSAYELALQPKQPLVDITESQTAIPVHFPFEYRGIPIGIGREDIDKKVFEEICPVSFYPTHFAVWKWEFSDSPFEGMKSSTVLQHPLRKLT